METKAVPLCFVGTNAAGSEYFLNALKQDAIAHPEDAQYDALEEQACQIRLNIENSPEYIQAFNTHDLAELEKLNQLEVSLTANLTTEMSALRMANPNIQKDGIPTDPNPADWTSIFIEDMPKA